VGVYVDWHVAAAPLPPNVQVVNVPVPELDSPTVPLGVIAVPGDVSVTVTVQLVELLTTIVVGWHEIAVVVARTVTLIVAVPWLVPCNESPLNVAVSRWVPVPMTVGV
jgi:hypothetical protein